MFNPNSAIYRIKNSLSYKLGLAIIECKKQHMVGYITLPYKLYKIKQQHFKEQKLYKQTIKIFPHLAYSKVESCKDYNESIKYKYHLSYILGETLIKAHKTWYKGGYFKLPSLLKEKYKIYKNIQNITSILPQKVHYRFYNFAIKNHKINIQDLADILKQHKDYKPILENIFHNFDFFVKHFDLIRIWLSSKDFKEKYKQENHPYPSLLDPKKLNNVNEKINYKNIPAELAWEMNLPLPDNYKFVFLSGGVSGHAAMMKFLEDCYIGLYTRQTYRGDNVLGIYCDQYLVMQKKHYNILVYMEYGNIQSKAKEKLIGLFDQKRRVLFLVRDPISRLKSRVNHIAPNKFAKYDFYLDSDVKKVVDVKRYYSKKGISGFPEIDILENYVNSNFFCYASLIKNFHGDIFYIDMEEIKPEKAFDTMCALANKFGFSKPIDKKKFSCTVFDDTIGYFPMRLHIGGIIIIINTEFRAKQTQQSKEYINIVSDFFDKPLKYDNLGIFIKPQDYEQLKQNGELLQATKKYLVNFIKALEERIEIEKSKLFKEDDVLNYLKENKELRIRLKELLDKELVHIKQYRPDIVASWKYYQEFEKMCKELDGD